MKLTILNYLKNLMSEPCMGKVNVKIVKFFKIILYI